LSVQHSPHESVASGSTFDDPAVLPSVSRDADAPSAKARKKAREVSSVGAGEHARDILPNDVPDRPEAISKFDILERQDATVVIHSSSQSCDAE